MLILIENLKFMCFNNNTFINHKSIKQYLELNYEQFR